MNITSIISELLFPTPRICPLCKSKQNKLIICDTCLEKLSKFKKAAGQCQRCGSFGSCAKVCNNCRNWPKYFRFNKAAVPYEKEYREVLHLFKFRRQGWLVPVFVDLMIDLLPTESVDLIIPVPLHKNRLRERGFNQSALIAKELALRSELTFNDKILIRQLDTPHQTGLDLYQRQRNLLSAFKITDSEAIKGKSILLIDDTFTTGTTLLECARTLHQSGGRNIYGMTFAAGIR